MTVQKVTWTVQNGRLGVRQPVSVELHAYVGPASAGTVNVPVRASRGAAMLAGFGSGPLVEAALRANAHHGAEALMVRATATAGVVSGLITTGVLGTSVVTIHGSAACDDDYEAKVRIVVGGTQGVEGITYQTSLDAGRNWSAVLALGTATSITIANSGGVQFALGAGTLLAGDTWSAIATAPVVSTGDLTLALAPLKASNQPWDAVWICAPVASGDIAAITTFLNDLENTTGRSKKAYVHLRMPNVGESKAAYRTAMKAIVDSITDRRITCCASAARVQSARVGRPYIYRRPPLHAIAGLPARLPLGVDMSQTIDATPGGLPGVWLYDESGNNVELDEMLDPGLSDDRLLTLRTWPDKSGVYVNDPKTLEGAGLDFHLDQFARILAVFCNTVRSVLSDELSRGLDLNLKTNGVNKAGAPTERECQRIDARVRKALLSRLAGQVSGIEFSLNRDDDVLGTQTLNAEGGVVFLGYPKLIVFSVSAINPAG